MCLPRHEEEFLLLATLRRTLALVRVLEIIDAVTTFADSGLLHVVQEVLVGGVARAEHFDVDLLLILKHQNKNNS